MIVRIKGETNVQCGLTYSGCTRPYGQRDLEDVPCILQIDTEYSAGCCSSKGDAPEVVELYLPYGWVYDRWRGVLCPECAE